MNNIEYDGDGVIYISDKENKILDIIYLSDNETTIFNILYKNINKLVRFDDSPDMNLLGPNYTAVIVHRINRKINKINRKINRIFRIKSVYGKGYILINKKY